MVDVTTEVDISRPRDHLAAFTSEPDNATEGYENIASARWRSPRPFVVSSRIAFVARFLER